MNPTPPGDSGGFLARNLSRILVGALVGLLVGGFFALRSPAGFEATTEVLVTRLAAADLGETSLDGTTPLDAEIRFAKSGNVRDLVRGAIPTAPDTIDVEAAGDTNVLAFTAPGDTADEAVRLSRNWASSYISTRRDVLIETWTNRLVTIQAEMDDVITELGTARLAGNDGEAARLEGRRDTAAAEEAAATNAISALESEPGAELFGDGPIATETGRSLPAMAILGTILGALLTGAWRRWREQQADDEAEAESWLHQATEGSLDVVLTTGMLEVPAFLADDAPPLASTSTPALPAAALIVDPVEPSPPAPVPAPASSVQPTPPAATPAVHAPPLEPAPAPAPPIEAPPSPAAPATPIAPPATPAPTPATPAAAGAAQPEQPRMVPAALASTTNGTSTAPHRPTTLPKRPPEPLRIANIANAHTPTRRPVLSRADQAWADDISLISDT